MRAYIHGRPRRIGRPGPAPGALPALLVAAALVAGTCGSPTPSPSASPGPSGTASTTPATSPTASPSPSATPEPWTSVTLPAFVEVATLEPVTAGEAGVAPTTAFRLTSRDGTPVAALAARLAVEPTVQLIAGTPDGATVLVRPGRALTGGEVYRFTLSGADGSLLASWAMPVATPPRVEGTMPSDRSTRVPVNTGVEVVFDQPGITAEDLAAHWRIEPAVRGRFEVQGRVAAFIPDALARDTLYTVTVSRGLPLRGTGLTLPADVVFRFETGAPDAPRQPIVTFRRPMADASTTEQAAIAIQVDRDDDTAPAADTVGLAVHRLASLDDALRGYRTIRDAPDWTITTGTTPIATAALPEVLRTDVPVRTFGPLDEEDDPGNRWVLVPRTLPAGWYVVTMTHRGVPRQALLQVTDLATFALVSVTRSVAWVNDVANGSAVAGASVTLAGAALGTTGADGLLVADTPEAALAGTSVIVTVRSGSRVAFTPVDVPPCEKCDADEGQIDPRPDRWWTLLSLDRVTYRSTDTVSVWGVVRDRDRGSVPAAVDVELTPWADDGTAAPVLTARAAPNATGTYLVSLRFTDLPRGEYQVSVRVGGVHVADTWLRIAPITKPAYEVAVTVSPRAVIAGDEVTATARATFFEGTPVAGLELRFQVGDDVTAVATTGPDGTATARLRPPAPSEGGNSDVFAVEVYPTTPEEAEIAGGGLVTVFGAAGITRSSAVISGTQLVVTGSIHRPDLAAYAALPPGAEPWGVDPFGAPVAGATVSVQVTESWAVRRQVGTAYDFITKRTEPVYDWDWQERDLGTRTVRSGADGTFRLASTVTGGDRTYEVRVWYTDAEGRTTAGLRDIAFREQPVVEEGHRLWLTEVDPLPEGSRDYAVGDTIHLQLLGGRGERTAGERYLYAVAQRGIRYAVVGSGSRIRTTFTERSVPSVTITGVRFTGRAYEVDLDGYTATFRSEDRRMTIELAADRAAYAPGEEVALTIRTRDTAGRLVPATVFVRVLDEKLYAIGAAWDNDPLDDLYRGVGSGVTAVAWSHRSPLPDDDNGKGDTTGGGDRADFRDWLAARLVDTGADGTAIIRFRLSDDLTSWHATAVGMDIALRTGLGSLRIPVRLPFFAEATIASEYLAADRPIIRVRAYGAALSAGDVVTFRVSSDSLGMAPVTVTATAFTAAEVPLPALTTGTHTIRVVATTGSGDARREDAVIRTITVVESRSVRRQTTYDALVAGLTVGSPAATGLTSVTVTDAGRGRVIPLLRELASADTGRADRVLAAALAASILEDAFGLDPPAPPVTDDALDRFQDQGGVSVVPYADPSLRLSVLAALSGDLRVNRDQLDDYFAEILEDDTLSREARLLALAGQAAMGEPVLGDVRTAASLADLGAWERVALAAAAMAQGDEPLARTLLRAELAAHGQRLGPWVRLATGGGDEDRVLTGWLLMVAAWLGDPIALDLEAYLGANPPQYDLVDLQRAIAARGWVARVPGSTTVVAWTVDGTRREVSIAAGGALELTVTPAQRATLRLDPVSGSAIVTTSWDAPASTVPLVAGEGMRFTRRVLPTGPVGSTDLVIVTFEVALGDDPVGDCWRVTDFAPSGLAPLAAGNPSAIPGEETPDWIGPWGVSGQRVDFCVTRDPRRAVQVLRYVARVVTPGTYLWEPAILQSSVAAERGMLLAPLTLTIRGAGG